ncbi:hypothetical protein PACTADRAFT_49499 [Pachysolen tannophilus NRRL Y-2460]|uniref:STAS domain-containing protein n=1 Tax=Pachysolen tannophilus NRRL Y-2460 TaxID=669874 RepID=A0A1E4TWH3_PACTA|nr:hypothetical protein PACTADRAFT_49499 [Pachysolen tannophilus NRRL Y-2460]
MDDYNFSPTSSSFTNKNNRKVTSFPQAFSFSNPSSFHHQANDVPGSRQHIYGSFKATPSPTSNNNNNIFSSASPAVNSDEAIHEQAAELARVGVSEESDEDHTGDYNNNDNNNNNNNGSSIGEIPSSSTDTPADLDFLNNSNDMDNQLYRNPTYSVSPKNSNPPSIVDQADFAPYHPFHPDPSVDSNTPLLHDPFKQHNIINGTSSSLIPITSVDLENGLPIRRNFFARFANNISQLLKPHNLKNCVVKPATYFPAVFLGVLLNVLDGLSYGMIMFPLSEAVFSSMAPAGLSMFYISCIISQLVFSCGGSAFPSGIGSEMIEVTPFLHSMAYSILNSIGNTEENQEAIIATTMFAYAISSMVTGAVFYTLGKCKLGSLVAFFPRHILVGCIGGVGYFLVVTGIETSSRLDGGLQYTLPVLKFLLQPITLLQWTIPLLLAILLIIIQRYNRNALIVPGYFIAVFITFHLLIFLVPSWDLPLARNYGWIFESHESKEPWYGFYALYKFDKVHWMKILSQVPTMFALTFFGILHVPINVPALAVTLGVDEYDVDRELVAHGYSNILSGFVGSIQNYLVYTNSVLFILAGAGKDSHLSGIMLALGTVAMMVAGPVVIGYIPVCVVGALIYLLGYELLREALYDTWGRLSRFEYLTIVIIVITMGAWDFVYGILVGVLLACISFVVEAAQRPVISGVYTGSYARSTVLRHPKQQDFLKDVGDQIYILKLQGSLFFGSIGGLERKIRSRFEENAFAKEPVRYLVLDMNSVLGIDFSAAEGFRRIKNLIIGKNCYLIISSVFENSNIIKSLRDAGLWETAEDNKRIQLFTDLNSSLEWCENTFLKTYSVYKLKSGRNIVVSCNNHSSTNASGGNGNGNENGNVTGNNNKVTRKELTIPTRQRKTSTVAAAAASGGFGGSLMSSYYVEDSLSEGSPRHVQIVRAAKKTIYDEGNKLFYGGNDIAADKQPLPLILTIFQSLSDKRDVKFWLRLAPFFKKEVIPANISFHSSDDSPSMFLVENGLINMDYKYELNNSSKVGTLHASILPLTAFGNLRKAIYSSDLVCEYKTKVDSTVWTLNAETLENLKSKHPKLYIELAEIEMRLMEERFDTMTCNLIVSS